MHSYPQGVDVWGREGMRNLSSAANVCTYGGGVADPDWLEELSKLIGEHDVTTRSTHAHDRRGRRRRRRPQRAPRPARRRPGRSTAGPRGAGGGTDWRGTGLPQHGGVRRRSTRPRRRASPRLRADQRDQLVPRGGRTPRRSPASTRSGGPERHCGSAIPRPA
ncbi:TraG/TraD/VirD4 family protein [Micromonospora sp. RHAY321]|uniref:TraM recognition domain-containing protein n=1 Tax=Micromonospora sp. RHAY321 TaxID=2944807 RepID=UPI00207C1352|nr:TraM recognition domain-containing protein [Micromonospora sp. RHAY321]MCO1593843.1 TraG/TraD/VirD4 family protein [Micromonospora sp. RHAY321]